MAERFYTILTSIGKAKIANASALGNKVNFTHFALGDGNGRYYSPTESQTELINEVWRGQIAQITVDEKNPNWIVIETIIPADQGGFMIREAGIFDDENNLLAVGKYPETYKPVVADGSAKDLYIRMILEVANTSVVNLKVDPGVILATKKDIEVLEQKMNDEIGSIDIPVKLVNGKIGNVKLTANDVGAETPVGAQNKANEALNSAKSYTDQEVSNLAGTGRTNETVKENADNITGIGNELNKHKGDKNNPHGVTKSQVGLGNVTNDKQMPISGGKFTGAVNMDFNTLVRPVLESYSETVRVGLDFSGNTTLNPKAYNNWLYSLSGNARFNFSLSDAETMGGGIVPITLIIRQPSSPKAVTLDSSLKWANGEIPDLAIEGHHIITIMLLPTHTTAYLGFYGGVFK